MRAVGTKTMTLLKNEGSGHILNLSYSFGNNEKGSWQNGLCNYIHLQIMFFYI